jgi:hypothetical protein
LKRDHLAGWNAWLDFQPRLPHTTSRAFHISGQLTILLDHRVGRVLRFFSSRRNWDSPNPSPEGECAPTSLVRGGGAHSQAREGLGGSQFRLGDIHCGTLYMCTLCIGLSHKHSPHSSIDIRHNYWPALFKAWN